jgi:membrane-associated phospholipid phosphatase
MEKNPALRFFAVEKITFIYIFITSITIIFLGPSLHNEAELLIHRLLISVVIISLSYLNSLKNLWIIRFARFAFLGFLLSLWYPETFEINRVLPNCDYILAHWEQTIFGFQPAMVFSKYFHQNWFSEIMNMGYFAYYPLIIGTSLFFYFSSRKYFNYFFFTVMFAFFVYYLIYIYFPTAGPQYYFSVLSDENINAGIFPKIGLYFHDNQVLLPKANHSGFFFDLVEKSQQIGERPTAAFPSSHVGISTLIMILILKSKKYLYFGLIFPVYLALVFGTVYIQAHYLIDVFGGLVTSVLFFYLGTFTFKLFTLKYSGASELNAIYYNLNLKN